MISSSWILTVLIYFTKFYNVEAEYTCQVVKESGPFVKFQLEWHLPQHSTNRYVKFADKIHSACSTPNAIFSLKHSMHDILNKPGAINTLHLTIPKLQESDSGKYGCVARGLLLPSKFLKWFHPFPKILFIFHQHRDFLLGK